MNYTVLDVLATYMENTRQTNESRKASYEECFYAGEHAAHCSSERECVPLTEAFEEWWAYHRPVFHLDLGYLGYIEGCFKLGIPPHTYEDWRGATNNHPDVYTKLDEETRAYKEEGALHKM